MGNAAGGSAWNLRLAKYAAANFTARLQLLLEDSHVNSVPEDQQRLRVVLARLPAPELEEAVLKLMAEQAISHLAWCCQLFRAESSSLQVSIHMYQAFCCQGIIIVWECRNDTSTNSESAEKIEAHTSAATWSSNHYALAEAVKQLGPLVQVFTSVPLLAEAALTCLYRHKGVSSWDTLAQLAHHALLALQDLPQGLEGPATLETQLKEQLLEVIVNFTLRNYQSSLTPISKISSLGQNEPTFQAKAFLHVLVLSSL